MQLKNLIVENESQFVDQSCHNFPFQNKSLIEGEDLVLAKKPNNQEIIAMIEGPYSTQGLHATLKTSNKSLIHALEKWMIKYK